MVGTQVVLLKTIKIQIATATSLLMNNLSFWRMAVPPRLATVLLWLQTEVFLVVVTGMPTAQNEEIILSLNILFLIFSTSWFLPGIHLNINYNRLCFISPMCVNNCSLTVLGMDSEDTKQHAIDLLLKAGLAHHFTRSIKYMYQNKWHKRTVCDQQNIQIPFFFFLFNLPAFQPLL